MTATPFILCAGPFPALQRTLFFRRFRAGQVNRAMRVSVSAAGKPVNVARAVLAMGGRTCVSGFRGGETGNDLVRRMRREGLAGRWVDGHTETRICQTLVDEESGSVTELVEESTVPDPPYWEAWCESIYARLASIRMLVLSGTLPAGAPVDTWRSLAAAARDQAVPVIIDSHGPPLLRALEASPWLVKPNSAELAATLSFRGGNGSSIRRGIRQLLRKGAQHVIVTQGPGPTLVSGRDGSSFALSPPPAACRNPVGCGDTFTGVLAWAAVEGFSLIEAARMATAAATARCTMAETGVPSAALVREWLPRVNARNQPAL